MLQVLTPCSPCGHVVDFVRSAYRSTWFLPSPEGPRAVAAQYMFAPPNAPGYPGGHFWGSRNYTTDNQIDDATYGEVRTGTQRWTNGLGFPDTPPPTLLAQDCGGTPSQPFHAGICDPQVIIPRYINIRVSWSLGGSFQGSYALVGSGPDPYRYISQFAARDIYDCNPFNVTLGKITIGDASPIRFVCTNFAQPSYRWVFNQLLLFADGQAVFGPYPELQWFPSEPGYLPLRLTYTQQATLTCLGGPVTGTLSWTLTGEDTELTAGPIPAQDARDWYLGFPPDCWRRSPNPSRAPWPFSPLDTDWRRFAAGVLCEQYASPNTAFLRLRNYLGEFYAITRVDNSDSSWPGTLIGVSAGRCVIIISGTTNFWQLATQATSSLDPPFNFGSYSTLPFWESASLVIMRRLSDAGLTFAQEVAIAGHSYGAAIGQIVAYKLARANPRRRISLLTFGGPPIGLVPNVGAFPNTVIASMICNDGDPVANTPPAPDVLQEMLALVPGLPFNSWRNWRRIRQTTRLTNDGTFISDDRLTTNFADLAILLENLIIGGPLATPNAHFMTEYVRRLWAGQTVPSCGPD